VAKRAKNINVETEQEVDGRWIAERIDIPGCLAYGETKKEAIENVRALAQEMTERIEEPQ
jgi:predicted RNase H-like HicB family nuclease